MSRDSSYHHIKVYWCSRISTTCRNSHFLLLYIQPTAYTSAFPVEERLQSGAFTHPNWGRTLLLKCRPINNRRSNMHSDLVQIYVDLFTPASSPDVSIISLIQTTTKVEILIYGTVNLRGLNQHGIKPAQMCKTDCEALIQFSLKMLLILFLNHWRIWESKT